jgi:hypothetical protein
MNTFTDVSPREQTTHVAHALCRRVSRYFEQQVPGEHAITIRVESIDQSSLLDGRAQRCELVFVLANGTRLPGALLARYLGGNMYEVDASVGERMKRFTLCLPQPAAAENGSGARICDYLFDEVKRAAGELFLKEISQSCRPGSFELY